MPLRERVAGLLPRARHDLSDLAASDTASRRVSSRFLELGFHDVRTQDLPDGSHAVIGSRPAGQDASTVLLYANHATGMGNTLLHLTAVRALREAPVNLTLVADGSPGNGLARFVTEHPELFRADVILFGVNGNAGRPAVTASARGVVVLDVTVEALADGLPAGTFSGAAPDAVAALVSVLASLRDARGETTVHGLPHNQLWLGEPYPNDGFRVDAAVPDGVDLLGDGLVADMLWARPALTVSGIDGPAAGTIAAKATTRLSLYVPPGLDVDLAHTALVDHLHDAAPWGVRVRTRTRHVTPPFKSTVDGEAHRIMAAAMREVYGTPMTTVGRGGPIPLCTTLAAVNPDAELILLGVGEPPSHGDGVPAGLAAMAEVETRFLQRFARDRRP